MVAKIVIGANFGDEGKGLMTDYFCHQSILRGEKCLVVLHNGGAQRGHTVVTPDGKKHIFHHFGSGTFVGADSYFSEEFILNPIIFRQEWEELEEMGIAPKVIAHVKCRVTTPYEMIANQIIEDSRAENRHGSCGMGIYETIKRYERTNAKQSIYGLYVLMGMDTDRIRKIMKFLRKYIIKRLQKLGIKISKEWMSILKSDNLIENYINDLKFMFDKISMEFSYWISNYDSLVFENGQGLFLDQNNKEYYPHLTPSNTGIKNPLEIISKMDRKPDIEVCYVTRTYLTRHGAGRLDGECDKKEINPDMQDLTNVPNPHQGTLRYAKLVEKSLEERILKDFEPAKKYGAKLSLAVTHENEYGYVFSDRFKKKFDCIYYSDGETRESFRKDPDEG